MQDEQLWQAALGQLELKVSQSNFLTWFRGTRIIQRKEGIITINTPSPFAYEWLSKKYRSSILDILRSLDTTIQEVRFSIHSQLDRRQPIKKNSHIVVHKQRLQPLLQASASSSPIINSRPMTAVAPVAKTLNQKYTFESFVVGASNEVAHAACRAVTAKPGETYNPLFIYGGVGLGKTHLLQAVGNALLNEKRATRVLYVSSEKFMNDFVQSIRDRSPHAFKKYYREVDVLIIDDIQLLAGKAKTQEELFHTFNALHSLNKQVILSSDRPPKAIPTLEERLSSRLAGGMIADIKQPDYETRLAIITKKAQLSEVEINEDALAFIAKNVQRNVRELEGALNRVLAHCDFNKQRATLDYIKKVMEGIMEKPQARTVDVNHILHVVSSYYNLPMPDLCGKSRKQEIVKPRQVAMYLLRKESNISFPSIGSHFGGRDHTTAMHACEKIGKLLEHDEDLSQEINFIRERLYA